MRIRMTTSTFRIGDSFVHRIVELDAPSSPVLEFLPALTPEQFAESRAWLKSQRALDDEDRVLICYQSYVVRTPQHNVLVDTCLGNHKDRPHRPLWHQRSDNRFMAGLAQIGLAPGDIHYVLCTHLHTDHVGWNTRLEDGRWVPTFPNARYLFSGIELEYWLDRNAKTVVPAIADSVVPILDAKQCDIVRSDYGLSDLLSLVPAPGHTIDHYAVTLGKHKTDAVFTGDLIHSPLQARWPELSMRLDHDPAQGIATRRSFLEKYCDTPTLCCFAHFPSPSVGHVKRWGDGYRCDYVNE
ncbi:MBL fold metallo-hydrolase [Paraburkholderia steynii]|uniref:MBL fold metallo-hydrolase n=1 Tax=Paraburkholderia steynii TaxID=1245441 RepID=A0A4R0XN40_9BURK|nr:MBL fold metallo-hydrolase [Paraburkholderia steynii]